MGWLASLLLVGALLVAALVIAGQVGLFGGTQPGNLGVRDGRLKPPSRTPNSVTSQATLHADHPRREDAAIAPLPLAGTPAEALGRLRSVVVAIPGARVVEERDDYLYAQFKTRWLGFTDDVEFLAAPAEGVIHVRSASRVGRRDYGANRGRIEAIRARFHG